MQTVASQRRISHFKISIPENKLMKYSNSALEKGKQYKTLAQQKEGNYKGKTEINLQNSRI